MLVKEYLLGLLVLQKCLQSQRHDPCQQQLASQALEKLYVEASHEVPKGKDMFKKSGLVLSSAKEFIEYVGAQLYIVRTSSCRVVVNRSSGFLNRFCGYYCLFYLFLRS